MERVTRIELVTKAWEAAVIPFHHTRRSVVLALLCAQTQAEFAEHMPRLPAVPAQLCANAWWPLTISKATPNRQIPLS